jgi:hypothetical protein
MKRLLAAVMILASISIPASAEKRQPTREEILGAVDKAMTQVCQSLCKERGLWYEGMFMMDTVNESLECLCVPPPQKPNEQSLRDPINPFMELPGGDC